MRRAATAIASTIVCAAALAATPPMWGPLQRGPYAVGYQQIDRYDYTRLYWMPRDLSGKPRTFERARPMRVSVWYPAKETSAPPLRLGDFIDMMGTAEERISLPGEAQKRDGAAAFYGFVLVRPATPEQRKKIESLVTMSQRNAPAVPGKFPLILYSLGSAALANVTPEYLASHGYVVMQMPRVAPFAGLALDTPTDTADKVRDTDFMLQVAHEVPQADLQNIGTIGFSAGGRWALSEAMKTRDVHAVVSLDSVMLFNDVTTADWKKQPYFSLEQVRVPVLHMVRRAWVPQQDAAMWDGMRFADRTMMVFEDPALDHFDFQSLGYVTTLAGMRSAAANSVGKTFETFNRLTLAFLDAHLKGGPPFAAPADDKVTVSRAAATPSQPQLADFMNAIAEGSMDSALSIIDQFPEPVINLAAYNLLGGGRVEDAKRLFQANVDLHPQSANAYDSLADAYVAAGDTARAAELARKAVALLDADKSIPAERKELIRQSIQQKLTR